MYTLAQTEVDAPKAENCYYIICLGYLGIDEEFAQEISTTAAVSTLLDGL